MGAPAKTDRNAEIMALLRGGWNHWAVAKKLGISTARVSQIARRYGYRKKRPKGSCGAKRRQHEARIARFAASPLAKQITQEKQAYWRGVA